jgi:hypothetical protein
MNEWKEINDNRVTIQVHTFNVHGHMLFTYCEADILPYIERYIDSVNSGNPDKESIINELRAGAGRGVYPVISEINNIEHEIKHILDAIAREKKINQIMED